MARTDHIWSASVAYAVAYATTLPVIAGQEARTVDIYYDPKSLCAAHREAWELAFRKNMVSIAKSPDFERWHGLFKSFKIRHIEEVPKPKRGVAAAKLQLGTWLADRLCSKSEQIISSGANSRIRAWDMSEIVTKPLRKSDAKPPTAD
jgi:hypothetical protein